MAVPEFKYFILPVLKMAADQREHSLIEARDYLKSHFSLSEADLLELLPSGIQSRFSNRVQWARTYLVKAGLLAAAGRGKFKITDRGLKVLRDPPKIIDKPFLRQFDEFKEFSTVSEDDTTVIEHDDSDATPQEVLERTYQDLRRSLALELLDQVKKSSPAYFERIVVDLLVRMGYGGSRHDAGAAVGRSGDGGIDGVIKEDRLGLDVVLIQAKRWDNPVGRPVVQGFAGSLDGQRAKKGVFITTSTFTSDAREYVKIIEKKIVLIDGEALTQLMIDFDIGVAEQAIYKVKKLDLDYFDEQ